MVVFKLIIEALNSIIGSATETFSKWRQRFIKNGLKSPSFVKKSKISNVSIRM